MPGLSWFHSTFGQAMTGAVLLWLALPPMDLWPLAWIAPLWWVRLIRMDQLPLLPLAPVDRKGTVPFSRPSYGWCLRKSGQSLLGCGWCLRKLGQSLLGCGKGQSHFRDHPTDGARENWDSLCWVTGWCPPRLGQSLLRAVALLGLAASFFLGGMAVNGLFLARQYRDYWLAEIVFWPLGLLLLAAAARLAHRRPYTMLWLVGFFFWLAALQWLRLPHWATGFGWLALSFYFAFYLPVFIGISRVAVHRLRVPVIVAAPVVWTGLELARAHLLTGMTMASLGHTQYRWTQLIQVSDLGGAFAVSFLVLLVAACLACLLPCDGRRGSAWPLLPAAAALAAVLAYGQDRLAGTPAGPGLRVALIQGNLNTQLHSEEGMRGKTYRHYGDLSWEALERFGRIDLMVWPETIFPDTWITYGADAVRPPAYEDLSEEQFREKLTEAAADSREAIRAVVHGLNVPMLLGVDRRHFGPQGVRYFNSSVHVLPSGELRGHYDKNHLVMFGEYVPFAEYVPLLQRLTPLSVSVSHGQQPAVFHVGQFRLAPNICYETVLSHVIRRQVELLRRQGEEPDVLVNLTNDGWFWGSNELEMHLACGVFRAVECRKPLLIAANTGISAWIDGSGRLLAEAPRHATDTLLAEVCRDGRPSFYLDHGDWPAGLCLLAAGIFALAGIRGIVAGLPS